MKNEGKSHSMAMWIKDSLKKGNTVYFASADPNKSSVVVDVVDVYLKKGKENDQNI